MIADYKLAVRSLRKRPGFAAITTLTLAVAIGACTTVFSVLYGAILGSLPYPNPESLVNIWAVDRAHNLEEPKISKNKADFFRARSDVFSDLSLFMPSSFSFSTGAEEPTDLVGLRVSTNYLNVLGLQLVRGRFFTPEDSRSGAATAIISDALWKGKFASDPNIIGRIILLNRTPSHIIGVLPSQIGVAFGKGTALNRTDVLVPLTDDAVPLPPQARTLVPIYQAVARLAPGVNLRQAQLILSASAQQYKRQFPAFPDAGGENELRTLKQQILGNLEGMLWILFAVVVVVLLIACANVANLFLARANSRWNDIVIEMSLGASRSIVIRQFFAEATLFCGCAAVLGVALAWGGIKAVIAATGSRLPRADQISMDSTIVGFSLGLALLCAVIITAYPAWRACRTGSQLDLKHSGRTVAGGSKATRIFRGALVVVQVQMSLVLLTCTGLLGVSFYYIQKTDPGFAVASRAFGYISLPASKYATPDDTRRFFQRLDESLATAPQLAAGGAIAGMPLLGGMPTTPYAALGRDLPPIQQRPMASGHIVTPGYFRAMGIHLREGRFFTDQDRFGGEATVIINETLAKSLFPYESALDKMLLVGPAETSAGGLRIVGVIRDVKSSGLALNPPSEIYIPHAQLAYNFGTMTVVGEAKSGFDASAVIPVLRRVLTDLDPSLVLTYPQTLSELVRQSTEVQRLTLLLLGAFSVIALLLACVGIYSVVAYSISQQTNEIGIRMALGAQRRQIIVLVLAQGMKLVAVGLVLGLLATLGATRFIQSMLYQVKPLDPLIIGTITIFFVVTGVAACLVPSLRASRVDPLVALRAE